MVIILDDPWCLFPIATHSRFFDMVKDAKTFKNYNWLCNDNPIMRLIGFFGSDKNNYLKTENFYVSVQSMRCDRSMSLDLSIAIRSGFYRAKIAKRISNNPETCDELIESLKKGII